MRDHPRITAIDWRANPLEVMARWPARRPLFMLHSGRLHSRWARWSVLASPVVRYQFGNDGRSRWVSDDTSSSVLPQSVSQVRFTHDPLVDLDAILTATRHVGSHDHSLRANNMPPFAGGWIGYVSYDLGRVIEPRAQTSGGARDDRHWPLIDLAWCPDALIFDHQEGQWFAAGHSTLIDELESPSHNHELNFELGPFRPDQSRSSYESMVRQTIEAIAAGDVYQANIAQRFTATILGSQRALAHSAFAHAQPWYGAYLELPNDRSLVSMSPELFQHVDPLTRTITTRPIKGTRASSADPAKLKHSAKDAAELHMIVDLMRNDLGRVCEIGSVKVVQARAIESHPTVHHGVGEVAGVLRESTSVGDILRATFPGGSITGAPKIRAMQIIDELEPVRRGPYCGAIGCFSDCGTLHLNIAIRTLLVSGGRADYWAGAGIVAESDSQAEYKETLDKSAVVQTLCHAAGPAFAV